MPNPENTFDSVYTSFSPSFSANQLAMLSEFTQFDTNTHLLLLCLSGAAVYHIGRICEPDLKVINFAEAIEGRRLNGSVIKVIDVDSESSCSSECVDEERCQSYNFGLKKNKAGKFTHRLSYSDRFASLVNFTEDKHFKYKGIQVTFGFKLTIFFQHHKTRRDAKL